MSISLNLPATWEWSSGVLDPLGLVYSFNHAEADGGMPVRHFLICCLSDKTLHMEVSDLTTEEPGGTLYGADLEANSSYWVPDDEAVEYYLNMPQSDWILLMRVTRDLVAAGEFSWIREHITPDPMLQAALSTPPGRSEPFMTIFDGRTPPWDGDHQDGPDPDDFRDAKIFDEIVRDAEYDRD